MIDSVGGARRVNNLLTTLNIKAINCKNLQAMEQRVGPVIEDLSRQNAKKYAREAFDAEMK